MLGRIAPGTGRTVFAGRTDRGVHAVGQVVSVDVRWTRTDEALRNALNAVGPEDIGVLSIVRVGARFHARYDARWREYRYRIVVGDVPPVLERRYTWWRSRRVDAERANRAAARLVGGHSFGTFAGNGRSQDSLAGSLDRVVQICEWQVFEGFDAQRHELRIVANGFLPQMVRNIVAAVVRVGQGDEPVEWIDQLLAGNDRRLLGDAAPASGLVLWRVEYDDDGSSDTGTDVGVDREHREE